ncbi:PAS domain S-box protein [Wenzhouxiangella sp. AB-CW3]|uniref:PAS domain S-box protein n=1 Tax=Wenzhouxiangella sp. AB-CW3 TaxID=2771012 RepID=UPI00168A8DA8|nr:PAS domain S-box protein [Wenzhouxiangella sp. AB-CW3]QOC23018.1 PAS domain S-box protein [Wenzhouxiangella sp. AB-CW3]
MKPEQAADSRVGLWRGGVLLALFGVFLLDLLVPLGIAHAALYALVVVLAALSGRTGLILLAAGIATILGLAAFWLQYPPQPGIPTSFVVVNRIISIVAVLASAGLGMALVRRAEELQKTRHRAHEGEHMREMAGRVARLGAWSMDRSTGRVSWTPEAAEIHDQSVDGMPELEQGIDYYAPEFRHDVRETLRKCLDEGVGYDREWQLQLADGRRRWVRAIGEPTRDSEGRIVGAHGALQDIDHLKRTEAEAQLTRTRLWQLANAMPMMVWTADTGGQLEFQNRFILEYTGVGKAEALVGDRWIKRLHPDDRQPVIKLWQHCVDTGSPYSTEFRVRRHDGQYRWFHASASPIKGPDGEIDAWIGACIDVEEQRRLADRLVETLETISDVFYTFDRDWRFTYINASGERLSGLKRDQLIGEVLWDKFPDVQGTDFEHRYRHAMESGEAVHFTEYYPGFDVWLETKAFPTEDGLAVFLRDITSQRQAEDRLRQAQRLEAVGQLTGGLAHDFNNLLTVIGGNAELVSEMLGEHDDARELVKMILAAAERGSDLTRRLLAFARKQTLEPAATDINRLIADMEPLLRHTLGDHIESEFARAGGLWRALIDPGQLEDALLNLCLNARDAMVDGGRLTIETYNAHLDADYCRNHEEVDPGQYVAIAVSDTGHGMDKETASRAFEPFFSGKTDNQGTGLGLAMVFGFVKQSGGHIKIYTEPDQGTTVRLYLPRTHQNVQPHQADPIAKGGGKATVMLVEDDELVREYARRQLEVLGYGVIEAEDGPDALERLEQVENVDVLFTDVVMPGGMSGRDLAEVAMEKHPDVKVLYTSGYTENAIVHHGRLDPGVHMLSKPWRRDQLARALQEVLSD